MKLGIASDHRGYKLKELTIKELLKMGYEVIDYGTNSEETVDYPDFAFLLSENVVNKNVDFGIAMCGSGAGMTIACNKVKGIRCANVIRKEVAESARNDDNINIIAIDEKTSLEEILLGCGNVNVYIALKDVPFNELRNEVVSKLAEIIHEENKNKGNH